MNAAARVVVDLLNTRAHSTVEDTLAATTPGDLELARAVRSDLLALLADPTDAAHDWAAFTGRVAGVEFREDFSTPGHVRTVLTAGDPYVGEVVLAVADLVRAGDWSRIRLCANAPCAHAFYDTTRSRTRRWHSYEICGNRTNVAAYRARTT
ncbi:MAG TPA: CGNR zinc finger domain-containing protein [Umezawaea sp.]|nr:CGNR zinc finger domain-containing protein [Umezawaea sp.]